ncbi:fructose PTS transporter subunit IIA [Endozoicomonas arenosclerae]|uniref:fructose PTS transporter subunit IIA n=1 Tax=Endozoicomonas arenosclerae TaxID=1633495 RepID=UPI0007828D8B|nr:fructose PTS transporter subunit IIA [Endozoicomonas arenosclerae]
MNLANLTSENLILVDAVFEDRIDAITKMTQLLADEGKLSDQKTFFDAVMKREHEGPTALGEELAVPHGKSEAVKEAVFAAAFVKDDLQWQGLDGDEPVKMIFLLAIPPAEAGSTHMEVLTELTSSLVEDEFREQLLKAKSAKEVLTLFGGETAEEAEVESTVKSSTETLATPVEDHSSKAYYAFILGGIAIALGLFALM